MEGARPRSEAASQPPPPPPHPRVQVLHINILILYNCYLHFTDEDTGVFRGEMTCPGAHSC